MQLLKSLKGPAAARDLFARKDCVTRHYQYDGAVRRLLEEAHRRIPSSVIAELYAHWGDPLSQDAERYLASCMNETLRVEGPVLQCGAGLATVVLGALCARSGEARRHLWCLEQDPHWANYIRSTLTLYGIGNTSVVVTRPQLFDGYVWYALDTERLPKQFALALCDGARATPRGVVGLIERLEDRLPADSVILANGVFRPNDQQRVANWARGRGSRCVLVDKVAGFIKVSRQPEPAPDAF